MKGGLINCSLEWRMGGGKNITFDYDEAGYIGKLAPFITIVVAKEALALSLPFGLRLLRNC